MFTTRHAMMAIFAGLWMVGMSSRALAATALPCGNAPDVLKALKDKDGEIPAFAGVTPGGADVIVVVSPKGSWSMLVKSGDKACFLAVGDLIKGAVDAKPETKAPTAAPAMLEHGLRLISQ